MKKIILSLLAIMMVSMSSVAIASDRGGRHHRGHDAEVVVRYENGRGYDRPNYYRNDRDDNRCDYRDDRRMPEYRGPREDRDYDMRYREEPPRRPRHEYRHYYYRNNTRAAGIVLGAAALILLTSH